MAKPMMDEEEAPKNPFKGLLGGDEEEEAEGEDGDYSVTPEETEAAGEVRAALKTGSDEELAKALCMLMELHSGGG